MADNSFCMKPVKGRVMRVTFVNACGIPLTGSGGGVAVTKGFVSLEPKPQYEDGQDFKERNADGDYCINDQDPPALTKVEIDANFCIFDPAAAALMSGQDLQESSGIGTGLNVFAGTSDSQFILEVWSRLGGSGRCIGSTEYGFYTVFNYCTNFRFLDWSIANARFEFKAQFDALESPVADTALWSWNRVLASAIPTEYCGTVAYTP